MALMPVADALKAVLEGAAALGEETVALDDAVHRTLARDAVAQRTQPPADMSAMDGYAVRAADASLNARLKVVGEVAAGKPFGKTIGTNEAARIFTGGVIPSGADAVVIQEDTARDGDIVVINEAARPSRHIRKAGIDFREGDIVIAKGTLLSDRHLALAASANHPRLVVYRRPKVAILATGDELVMPGKTPGPGQIVYSNGFALRPLMRAAGADIIDLGVAADTMDATTAAISKALELNADVLVTTGGASVGEHDLVKRALESEGTQMSFWRIAMRPGKPMMSGQLGTMRVLGLPGNPVSSYVCGFLFVVPLIRALSGASIIEHPLETAVLARDLAANDMRQDYLRARLDVGDDGRLLATPVNHQDSSLVANLALANALIVRPPRAPAASKGDPCRVLRLPR
ncbi:MAG: molybdopterin molybdotransferase MoeA [Afipia sp.]|nr:molybdopterin molybdotransferase MoeA [Afipia sp.]